MGLPEPEKKSALERLEESQAALERLQALLLTWTPEERSAYSAELRWRLRRLPEYMRFLKNADSAWKQWLATTRQDDQRDGGGNNVT